jgi:hypothetical protein
VRAAKVLEKIAIGGDEWKALVIILAEVAAHLEAR